MRTRFVGLLLAAIAAACGPNAALECGEGTENKNGTCVAVVDPLDSCGEGTVFDDDTGKCEPVVACGPGTIADEEAGLCVPVAECGPGTELNLGSGECVPVASCGPGTILDEDSGECRAETQCGAGTVEQGGACVAVDTCGPGTVRDVDTGLCESNTACGPGQVIASGLCVSPNVAVGLEADAREGSLDANDPLYGGTPIPLTLEPIGAETVFVGNIGRPVDLNGSGTLVQDRDLWSFVGAAGQYLEISVLGTGLPQPAFILEGPRGYRRQSALLSTNNTSRQVLLPYDGTYVLTVVPTAFLSTNLPVGGPNAGYVGVIREKSKPVATPIVPAADQALPLEITGQLRDLSDNFFRLAGEVGDAVALTFDAPSAHTPPAVLVFDADGQLVTHVELNVYKGKWAGTLIKDAGTTLVIDWIRSSKTDDAYTLFVARAPHIQGGVVSASGRTAATSIPGHSMAAFTVSLPAPRLLFWRIDDTLSPDLQVQNDSGTFAIVHDDSSSFFYGVPGSYTFFVFNDDSSEDDAARLVYDAVTPIDLGALDPLSTTVSKASGQLLSRDLFGPRSAWLVARTTVPALLRLEPYVELGDPELVLYDVTGERRHSHQQPRYESPVHALMDDQPLIIELETDDEPTFGWEISASALPLPLELDAEPNDTFASAVDLGALPAAIIGSLGNNATDVYSLTLDAPLLPGQAIEIQVENLDATPFSATSDSAYLAVFDETELLLHTAELDFANNNLITYINAVATQSSTTFYLQVTESDYENDHRYLLRVRLVEQPTENEPNDTRQTAESAPSLPITWAGHWASSDALDYYSFSLDTPLSPTELLRVRFTDVSSNNDSIVALEDAAGNVLAEGTDDEVELFVPSLPAGRYYVRVDGAAFAVAYRLRVQVIPAPLSELEVNDSAAEATALGSVSTATPRYAFGYTHNGDEDWFKLTVPSGIADDQGIRLRCLNVVDSTPLLCELYSIASPASPVLLGVARDDDAVLVVSPNASGPYGVRVLGTSSSTDFYYVRVEIGAAAEHEPNNSIGTAQPLGALAVGTTLSEQGSVTSADEDWFTFTLAPGFPADASVWVTIDNLLDTTNLDVTLYSASNLSQPLSHELDDKGVLVSAQTGGGTYALRVTGTSAISNDIYRITVEAGPRAELEPNDTGATSNALGALPALIYGVIGNTAIDVFSFSLPSDIGQNETLVVRFENLSDSSSYDVTLRPAGDTVTPSQLDDDVGEIRDSALPAGDYEVRIDGLDSSTQPLATDLYMLRVSVEASVP